MKDKHCSKYYHKKFQNAIVVDQDGCPMYRRRDSSRTIIKNGVTIKNHSVVPYNPLLLMNMNVSMFTSWMDANKMYNEGKNLTYAQFVYVKRNRSWKPRKLGHIIGRLIWVPHKTSELFYLKMMLTIAKGLQNYEEIKINLKILTCSSFADLQLSNTYLQNLTLMEIEKILDANRKSLRNYPTMPYPNAYVTNEQKSIFEKIMQAVSRQKGGMFFLYDYGGTNNTFMLKTLAATLLSKCQIVLTVTSSGITSLLLPDGRTTHSKFKIPVLTFEDLVCNIHQGSELADLLKVTKFIILDEALMTHRLCFEALDKNLRDIMRVDNNPSLIFGGKVVFGGDFRQVLLVVPRGSRFDIVHATINASYLWDHCEVLILTKNVFTTIQKFDNPIEAIVQTTYPNFIQEYKNEKFLKNRVILASTFDTIDQINDYVLSLIPGDERKYLSSDSIDKSYKVESQIFEAITPEFLNALTTFGLSNNKIKHKIGTQIMLLRNLDQAKVLCNGTGLVVIRLANHRQFLIIVSFIMTINKYKGQSLGNVGLYLPRPFFSHDQLYVVISRVKRKQ
ncbi:hypothetical protein GYH30_017710 [Glycine max]|nr:hypothetical protein GYH30_017710 [Glycine max]